MNMSDTPRTDALISSFPEENDLRGLAGCYNKLLEHARQLEQRNGRLVEALIDAESYLEELDENSVATGHNYWGLSSLLPRIKAALAKTKE
jgi:hypothetical protein